MKKHLLAGILSLSLILPAFPAEAAVTLTETVLAKDTAGNPVFTADIWCRPVCTCRRRYSLPLCRPRRINGQRGQP